MFDLTSEEARLLLNIALMAVGRNRFQSAAKIFATLDRFRPDQPSVAVGKAIALISALQLEPCLEYLDGEALVRFPGNPMLLAFKGMVLMRLNRQQDACDPLNLAAMGDDPAAAQLAGDLLKDCQQ